MGQVAPLFSVEAKDILAADAVLSKILPPSPLIRNNWMSEEFGCEVYLKLENMQPIGSFKIRGATYKISRLSTEERKRGVLAASAGNHAQGVAWGSRNFGVQATIVMPVGAPLTKIKRTQDLGAKVIFSGENYDGAYAAARKMADETGQVYVHAFEDPDVIAGQGCIALEILKQLPDVDVVIGSMGGGGLMTGVSIALKNAKKDIMTVGCQAQGSSALVQALRKKSQVTLSHSKTFADGIAVAKSSESIRALLEGVLDQAVEVDDDSIAEAVLVLIEKAKTVAEGSGAAPYAALDRVRGEIRGKKVVVIVSGGNIDLNLMNRIIDQGLIRAGRRLRVNVQISDQTGSLARLTKLIAESQANIIQAIHDRNSPTIRMDETGVELTLETRGSDHSRAVIESLKQHAIRVEVLTP